MRSRPRPGGAEEIGGAFSLCYDAEADGVGVGLLRLSGASDRARRCYGRVTMSDAWNWQCPFCGNHTTITPERRSVAKHRFNEGSRHGDLTLTTIVFVCPNERCKEFTLRAWLSDTTYIRGEWQDGKPKQEWRLIPAASVRVFPEYVPAPILADYREACLIRDLSPKGSATLSRRCLQGMIRDFWGIAKPRLLDEIDGIKDKVDPATWKAIDAVRGIGNIGAHMEKDINVVVDVDPGEAGLLVGLIETLIEEWYVTRHQREQRMMEIIAAAEGKKPAGEAKTPTLEAPAVDH